MAITTLPIHDDHLIRIHLTRGTGPHYAALRCVECNKHIQWLSSHETHTLAYLGVDVWQHHNTEGIGRRPIFEIHRETAND